MIKFCAYPKKKEFEKKVYKLKASYKRTQVVLHEIYVVKIKHKII